MKDRYLQAVQLRREGKTFKEIGSYLGVGVQRAREIVIKSERLLQPKSPHWTDGLDTKTANLLKEAYHSKEHLLEAIKNASERPFGMGPKTYEAIIKWLGNA